MKTFSVWVVTILTIIVILVNFTGCVDQKTLTIRDSKQHMLKTYNGSTFSVNYPSDWQTYDVFKTSNTPESYRTTVPEAVIFSPSQTYPTPISISSYVYPISSPFNKTEAENKLNSIHQEKGIQFSYLLSMTIDGATAYVYKSYSYDNNPYKNIIFRKGQYIYYIQGSEYENNLTFILQSFKATQQNSDSGPNQISNNISYPKNKTLTNSPSINSTPAGQRTVVNEQMRITLKTPNTWNVSKNDESMIELWGNDNPSGEGSIYFVQIMTLNLPSSSLDSAASGFQELLASKNTFPNSKIVTTNSQIGNRSAKAFIITENTGRVSIMYLTIYGDKTYVFYPFTRSDSTDLILKSIEFF